MVLYTPIHPRFGRIYYGERIVKGGEKGIRTSEPGVHEGYPGVLEACVVVMYPRFPRIQHRGKR